MSGLYSTQVEEWAARQQESYTGSLDPKCELVHKTDLRGGLDSLDQSAEINQFGR
jgi:hypothetical protein